MTSAKVSTEDRIRVAAAKVFTQKGFEATKTRDIADEAGINIASLHYYFRSKEKLFELIIVETMVKFSNLMDRILNGEIPLHHKIQQFVPAYIDFLKENPFLPMFIMSESAKNPEKIDKMMNDTNSLPMLRRQIEELIATDTIRPISLENFICNLIGLIVFPFISKELLQFKTGIQDEAYEQMLEERKQMIVDMLIRHMYYQPPA